ncbi:MAG: type II secretion system protein M [Anaerolineae bacterium]|nr:type II secretion system protein M [Anaerolineae bacterium]
MLELKTILEAVRELTPAELAQVRREIEAREHEIAPLMPTGESVQVWLADLDAAIQAFWEDTPPDERAAIVTAMQEDNYVPEDTHLFSDQPVQDNL